MNRSEKKNYTPQNCSAPEIGARVYDYYNGALDAEGVQEFERHLVRCRKCESVVLQLDEMMMILQDEEEFDDNDGAEAHPRRIMKPRVESMYKVGV